MFCATNFGLQATQPHLEYGSVYREKRPTTSGLRGTRRRAAARTGRTVPPPSVVPVGRDPPYAKARGRPLRISYPADLRRRGPDTYDFRPADRTDDCSASDFVISEALQQTDFDGIRHGVLSGWTASGRSRTRLRIRGIMGAVPTINTTLGACEGLDVVWLH